jgi:arabinofuranosyltransferase
MYLTRPDLVLLAVPVLIATTLRAARNRRLVRDVAIGLSPAVAWTMFALVYYGFPFPNTAYAKLTMGIHASEVWRQGAMYLIDSLDRDPLTLTTIGFGVLLGLGTRGVARGLAIGILFYLVYIASIGGDFMAGRFMTVPFFAATLVVGWLAAADRRIWLATAGVFGAVGLASAQIPLLSDSRFDQSAAKESGTVDERAMYFGVRSLVRADRQTFQNPAWPDALDPAPESRVIETCGLMGEAGLGYGPYTYLLDECGLADPLLGRLPAVFNHRWRVGHYRRMIPAGYLESVETGSNQLRDAGLNRYYEHLNVITRSDRFFSRRRLDVIWRMNLGAYDDLIDWRYYRHGGLLLPLEAVSGIVADGTSHEAPGVYDLFRPITITFDDEPGRRFLDVTLDSNDQYLLLFLKANRIVTMMELGPIPEHRRSPGLATYTENIPLVATLQGFDMLIVAPVYGDDRYAMGHLLLDGWDATDAVLWQRVIARNQGVTR